MFHTIAAALAADPLEGSRIAGVWPLLLIGAFLFWLGKRK